MMENQTNYYDKIEIWISTHLSTFEPEFRNLLSTPRLSQKKGVLIKKKVCICHQGRRKAAHSRVWRKSRLGDFAPARCGETGSGQNSVRSRTKSQTNDHHSIAARRRRRNGEEKEEEPLALSARRKDGEGAFGSSLMFLLLLLSLMTDIQP